MSGLVKHANFAIRMRKNGINMNFIKDFSINDIINCCDRLEKKEVPIDNYKDNTLIQEELIRDEKFLPYFNVVYKKNYNMHDFQYLLESIKNNGEKMSDYSIKHIFRVLDNKILYNQAYYYFLKYYSDEKIDIRKRVTNNLNYFCTQGDISFSELTEEDRELLKWNSLDNYNLIPHNNIKQVYEFLTNNKELRNIIDFFNSKKLYIPLQIRNYEKISENAKKIGQYLKDITNRIQNHEITYQMLLGWKNNGCSLYDLKVIKEKVENIENENLKNAVCNRTSYINFIYGNKLKRFPLDRIDGCREDIIIYAIREDKKSFLKLIEDNMEEFLSIPSNSILYNSDFYTTFVNLNEITLKNLKNLKLMEYNHDVFLEKLKKQKFTFEEIKFLYKIPNSYIILYNELLDLKVDDRLLRIKQLVNKDLLDNIRDNSEIKKIAEKIKVKSLYCWLENDFNKIKDIQIEDVIKIFIHYDNIKKFISEISNRRELSYIIRNSEEIEKYDSLESIKNDIEIIDRYWVKLKKYMEFNDDFLQRYSNNIKEFLLNDGAELAYTYYSECDAERRESFKLIVKALLMGEFKKLKYHTDDLKKEIDYDLKEYQTKIWTEENTEIFDGKYKVGEYDDFYHTMILGVYPKTTCLSYKGGMYNKCLLACFDSNKKILYVQVGERIVARAMVRLTKGKYELEKNKMKSLSFIDVEENQKIKEKESGEQLTLFLERPYISGVSSEEEIEIKSLFIKLLKDKSKKMNAQLVLSNWYNDASNEEFFLARYYMYISKSKSSSQYLDSLSGEATISDEGLYKENTFLIWKPNENENKVYNK